MNTIYYAIVIIAVLLILLIFVAFSLKKNDNNEVESNVETDLERKAKQALDSEIRKGKAMFITLLVGGIAAMLGKLWVWWFTPKKVAVSGGLLLLAGGFFSFITLTTVTGEFAINIRTPITIIPPENVEGLTLVIEGLIPLDSAGTYKPLNDIEFSRIEEGLEPLPNKVTLPTNKDGIAYIKYKGRGFNPEDITFKIKIIASTNDFDTKYYADSAIIKASDYDKSIPIFNLRKKRERVKGTMPFNADIKNILKAMKATENPLKTYSLRIYPTSAEEKNEQVGKFKLMKSSKDSVGDEFEWDGSSYIFKGLEFGSNLHIIHYDVFDSSKIKVEVLPDDPRININVNEGKPLTIAKLAGGNLQQPKAADVLVESQTSNSQYKIYLNLEYLNNILPQKNSLIEYSIKSSNPEFTENVSSELPDDGIIIYPKNPIENIERFWEVAGNLTIQLKFKGSKYEFTTEEIKKTKGIDGKDSLYINPIKNSKDIKGSNNKSKVLVINKDNFNDENEITVQFKIDFNKTGDQVAIPKIIRK